ncbi:MAG: peptidyl-prolyl cis-trans isomerase [Agathobacter sp.]|nr:peptidyl-prolyl cis-trans isomerase [Agathobacter sp.]
MKNRIVCCVLCSVLSISLLTGCKIGKTEYIFDTDISNNHTALSVNDNNCSVKEAMIYFCNYRNLYGKSYDVDLWDYDFEDNSLIEYVKDVTINEVTRVYCMNLLAKEKDISLTSDEMTSVNKAAEEYYASLKDNEIEYMGVSEKDVVNAYSNYALAEKLYNTLTQGVEAEVSDDDARVIKVQQIFVSSLNNANVLDKKIKNGEDFSSIASSYNESEVFEANVARGEYPKEVEEVAFELEDGEISDMIKAKDGYYFIKCVSKIDRELTEANKSNILVKREKEQFDDGYVEFIENAKFVLNEDLWDKLDTDSAKDVETNSFFDIYDKYFK